MHTLAIFLGVNVFVRGAVDKVLCKYYYITLPSCHRRKSWNQLEHEQAWYQNNELPVNKENNNITNVLLKQLGKKGQMTWEFFSLLFSQSSLLHSIISNYDITYLIKCSMNSNRSNSTKEKKNVNVKNCKR